MVKSKYRNQRLVRSSGWPFALSRRKTIHELQNQGSLSNLGERKRNLEYSSCRHIGTVIIFFAISYGVTFQFQKNCII